jgi:thiol-disulfide isomerase/thioredoxin
MRHILAIISIIVIGSSLFLFPDNSLAEEKVTIHFFDDRLCPVCKNAKEFVQGLKEEYPQIELYIHNVSDTEKLRQTAEEYGVNDYGIMAPTLFIGNPSAGESINFFQFRDFTSQHQEMIIRAVEGEMVEEDCCIIKIPLLNLEVDIRSWSLPSMTIILGSLDGLNVCSIGSLVLILSMVMVFNSKKRIFVYGGLFIVTTAMVYGILVFTWGKIFEILVGKVEVIRIIIGLTSLAAALYFSKNFWKFFKYGPTCQVSQSALVEKATKKLKKAFEQSKAGSFYLAGAIMLFATAITIVELPCSVGVPVAFTAILVEAEVSSLSYLFYILAYLFFYMLIEIIIFTGTVLTKKIWFAGPKTITWVTFAGAIVLFYLAFYYLF